MRKIKNYKLLESSDSNLKTDLVEGKNGIIILVSGYVKNHIMTHNKIGVGSVFKSGISEDDIIKFVESISSKVSGDGGAYEIKSTGIGYDLVLKMDDAKKLKDVKEEEVEKQEGPNKVKVPSIKTTDPINKFSTDRLTLIVRKSNPQFLPEDVKENEDIKSKIEEGKCYSLLTAFPGNPDIPKASEWNGGYAVIIPVSGVSESKRLKYLKTFESFSNYITENIDFDEISVAIEKFGEEDFDDNPRGQVLKYLFNLIAKSNEFKSYTIKSNESDFKLSISNDDNNRTIEIELDIDNDGIIMKFTDGDDVFQPTIVSVKETGGVEIKKDPWGGSYEEYSEEGYAFELDTEKFKNSLLSIKNYLSGEDEYINF